MNAKRTTASNAAANTVHTSTRLGVTLPSISPKGGRTTLRIGALSLSQEDAAEARWFTDRDLTMALDMVKPEADIILCSGARFWTDRENKKTKEPPLDRISQDIHDAARCPVLFEWPGEDDGPSAWAMAAPEGWCAARHTQYITEADQVNTHAPLVLAELMTGAGVIPVEGATNVSRLVLMICNEAKALDTYKEKNVSVTGLDKVFSAGWVLLHPSHRPYDNPPNRSGRDLVVSKKGGLYGARLKGLTQKSSRLSFGKGLPGPYAVVHAGPFRQRRGDFDRRVSVLAFQNNANLSPVNKVQEVSGLVAIRYAEFEV